MGLGGTWDDAPVSDAQLKKAYQALDAALAAGVRLFDHADIYTHGKSEQVFGRWLRSSGVPRDSILLQSKGGIVLGGDSNTYDLSADAIVRGVEASLERLQTDYLDLWLLHRPDPLFAVDEVAGALESLHAAGKVRAVGASNMHAQQLALLADALPMPLVAHQLELSLARLAWLDEGVDVNTGSASGGVAACIDWCRRRGVQLQAWGALAQGRFSGARAQDHEAGRAVSALAAARGVPPEAVVLAFLLRHPAHIQPVIGTTDPERIAACARAPEVTLTRDEWYALYVAARGRALP